MDITTGLEINLNNPVELHNSIERIREARNFMGLREYIIDLYWDEDGGETHRIPIIVEGPNLWVIGYLAINGSKIYFERTRKDGTLNYSKFDTPGNLSLQNARELLKRFESNPPLNNFQKIEGNECARSVYVMAVFIASEIVRNEVLELILLYGSMNSVPFIEQWSNFLLVYKEWERAARVLYQETGAICPVICVKGLRSRLSNLKKDENLQKILEAYEELMNLITNIVVTEDNEEEYKGLLRLMGLTIRQRES